VILLEVIQELLVVERNCQSLIPVLEAGCSVKGSCLHEGVDGLLEELEANSFVKNAGMNSVRELALQKILTLDYCSLLRMQSVARCDEVRLDLIWENGLSWVAIVLVDGEEAFIINFLGSRTEDVSDLLNVDHTSGSTSDKAHSRSSNCKCKRNIHKFRLEFLILSIKSQFLRLRHLNLRQPVVSVDANALSGVAQGANDLLLYFQREGTLVLDAFAVDHVFVLLNFRFLFLLLLGSRVVVVVHLREN